MNTSTAFPSGLLQAPELDAAFAADGYIILRSMLDSHTVSGLRTLFEQQVTEPMEGLYTSHNRSPLEKNLTVSKAISDALAPSVAEHFNAVRPVLAHWINKSEQQGNEMPLHQDWSITFEDRHTVAHLWCPMVDVDEKNGCMCVVPGSHRLFNNMRSGSLGIPYFQRTGQTDAITQTLPMKAGDVLAYHPALFHGSYANHSGKPRPVALSLLMEKDASMRFFHLESDRVSVYPLTPQQLLSELRCLEKGLPPKGERPLERMPLNRIPNRNIDACRLAEHHRAQGRGRVFRNEVMDRAFVEKGYLTLPLLDADDVARLIAFHQEHRPAGGERFTTFASADAGYCQAVDGFTKGVLAPHFERLFERHLPFWGNYFAKRPGAPAIPLHADLQYVDEPIDISINVWIPLCDVGPQNGGLGVVPCSHLYLNQLRGTNMTDSYRKHALVIQQRHGRTLSLKAGEAVVYDHRLLHFSTPNLTDAHRLAVTMVGLPIGAQPIHWFAQHEDSCKLEKFHLQSSKDLIWAGFNQRPSHLVPVETIEDYAFHHLSPDELPLNTWC